MFFNHSTLRRLLFLISATYLSISTRVGSGVILAGFMVRFVGRPRRNDALNCSYDLVTVDAQIETAEDGALRSMIWKRTNRWCSTVLWIWTDWTLSLRHASNKSNAIWTSSRHHVRIFATSVHGRRWQMRRRSRLVMKRHDDNILIVNRMQDVILHRDKGRHNAVIMLVRKLV